MIKEIISDLHDGDEAVDRIAESMRAKWLLGELPSLDELKQWAEELRRVHYLRDAAADWLIELDDAAEEAKRAKGQLPAGAGPT
jgi:hypothetical protein